MIDSAPCQQSITLAVNQTRLMQALRDTFSSQGNVLKELMQNARRAGSPRVEITADLNGKFLEVCDYGCGIEDFHVLLEVATSGWNAETIEKESAFGIGLVSALFCAERIEIISLGRRLDAKTADILSFAPVITVPCEPGPTRVRLHGWKSAYTQDTLKQIAAGFAIPVILNGEELPRVDADSVDFIDTPVGRMRLPAKPTTDWVAYLQGFRIASNRKTYHRPDPVVIHLDGQQFRGRVPDREILVDQRQDESKIGAGVRAAVRSWLQLRKEAGDHDLLVEHRSVLAETGCLALLNDIPVLPSHCLTSIEHSRATSRTVLEEAQYNHRMSRSEVEAMVLVDLGNPEDDVIDDVIAEYSGMIGDRDHDILAPVFNQYQYLAALQAWEVEAGQLDADHWLFGLPNLAREVGPVEIKLIGHSAEFESSGACYADDFTVAEAVEYSGPLGAVQSSVGFALMMSGETSRMVLGRNCSNTAAVGMYSSYTDSNDSPEEELQERDSELLDTESSAAFLGKLTLLLAATLNDYRNSSVRGKLASKRFTVTFDEKGAALVEES